MPWPKKNYHACLGGVICQAREGRRACLDSQLFSTIFVVGWRAKTMPEAPNAEVDRSVQTCLPEEFKVISEHRRRLIWGRDWGCARY